MPIRLNAAGHLAPVDGYEHSPHNTQMAEAIGGTIHDDDRALNTLAGLMEYAVREMTSERGLDHIELYQLFNSVAKDPVMREHIILLAFRELSKHAASVAGSRDMLGRIFPQAIAQIPNVRAVFGPCMCPDCGQLRKSTPNP